MLEIRDLSFRYRRSLPSVLSGFSMTLPDGQIGIVLGENGAGKTTLFRILTGNLKPEAGEVLIDGECVSDMNARRRASLIAYVPQEIRFGDLSVYDAVLSGRTSKFGAFPKKSDHDAVSKVITELGLEPLAGRVADTLSGGEKQKTAIARALAQEPKLLVFDEPTGNLDIANRLLVMREMKRLAHERGITVLSSVHDLSDAASLGDRFCFMKNGTAAADVSEEEITPELLKDVFHTDFSIVRVENKTIITGEIKS